VTDGLVVVDKPRGWTSHDVVGRLRRVYGQRRVGHAGTLDPDATGVLLVGLGRATRLLRFLQAQSKAYEGTVVFGVATDSLDSTGTVLDRRAMPLERAEVEEAARRFVGVVEQLPPMVSAVKVGGRKLYEAARAGEEIERAPRRVTIHALEVVDFTPAAYPEARIAVECSSGTYIRALAADLGTALGGCAHLADLRRTSAGAFTLADASSIEAIEADPQAPVRSPADMLAGFHRVQVGDDEARAVRHGTVFPSAVLLGPGEPAVGEGEPFAVLGPDGHLLAVYECRGRSCKPSVVMATSG